MAEIGDDVPPGRQSLSLVAPFPPNTDFCMSSTVPPRSSQNYRLNQKCSPSSSTGVSSGTAMDLESAGSSPTSQPGAYMVNMRAAGALPGWASTRRGWNATRHSFFDSFRARPSSIPPELRIVQNVQIEMQEIPNEQGSAPDVVDDCVEISDSNEKEQQCGRRSTWIKIIVLGLTFGTIIAIVVAFVVDGNSSDSTKLPIVNNTSSDYLGADGISTRSSDVQAAVEVYMPLVLSISNATALADSSSAQSKALTWLASSVRLDPETKKSNMSNQRVLTRYALAVLYYSTLGHMWLDSFGFLGPDSHECDWNLPLDDSFEVVGLVLDKQGVICNVGDGNSERYVEILNFGKHVCRDQLTQHNFISIHIGISLS